MLSTRRNFDETYQWQYVNITINAIVDKNWLYSIINHANLEDAGQVAAGDVDAHVRLVLPLHLARQQHLQGLLNNYFVFILD